MPFLWKAAPASPKAGLGPEAQVGSTQRPRQVSTWGYLI